MSRPEPDRIRTESRTDPVAVLFLGWGLLVLAAGVAVATDMLGFW